MGDEEAVSAIKEALIANEPKTAPIDPRFPNTNQVRRLKPLFPRMIAFGPPPTRPRTSTFPGPASGVC